MVKIVDVNPLKTNEKKSPLKKLLKNMGKIWKKISWLKKKSK